MSVILADSVPNLVGRIGRRRVRCSPVGSGPEAPVVLARRATATPEAPATALGRDIGHTEQPGQHQGQDRDQREMAAKGTKLVASEQP